MFAVYVPELREVMNRYIDVKDEQEVTFAGRKILAVPVEDRLGWQGSLTTHYLTRGGTYLGSENKEAHLVMLPSDAKTLLSIWKNADLTRPGGTEHPRIISRDFHSVLHPQTCRLGRGSDRKDTQTGRGCRRCKIET